MSPEIKTALNEIEKAREILNRYSDSWVLAFAIPHDDLKDHTSCVWQEGNFNACVGLMMRTLVTRAEDMNIGTDYLDDEKDD